MDSAFPETTKELRPMLSNYLEVIFFGKFIHTKKNPSKATPPIFAQHAPLHFGLSLPS